jgi:vitamin B12 transporter
MVVTATRTPVPLNATTQAVTVLRGDELRAQGVQTVAQALRQVPGAAVVQSGSYGGVTSLFLRGGESRYTKVLVDGVPVNDVGGSFFFENLTTDNIDRIEILRGPGSALYGADAMSGVIQVFTKRGSGTPHIDAGFRAGTYASHDADLALRGGTSYASYSIGGALHHTDGIYAFNNMYDNGTLSGDGSLTPRPGTELRLTTRYTTAEYHFPTDGNGVVGDSNSYNVQHRLTARFTATQSLFSRAQLQVIGTANEVRGLSEDLTAAMAGATPQLTKTAAPSRGYRRSGEVRLYMPLSDLAHLTLGGQYEKEFSRAINQSAVYNDSLNTTPVSTATSETNNWRSTHGYYAAFTGQPVSRLSYDASVRFDDHSDYKNATTYHAGVNIGLLQDTRLRVSYGTAFNAPAFAYTQGSAYNAPNPALQPERAHTIDAAIEQFLFDRRVRASFGVFDQHFSQLIQYVSATIGPQATAAHYENLTQARSKGFESELHVALIDGLSADASYTQTLAKVYKVPSSYQGSLQPGDDLLRRPSHNGALNLIYAWSANSSAAITTTYVGKRPDMDFSQFPSPRITLPSYVTVDLSANVSVLQMPNYTVALTGRIANLFDKDYQDVYNFPAPGRAVLIGARLTASR